MKRLFILLGITWSLSAVTGPSYAGDTGFMAATKAMLYNVAQRASLTGGISYQWNDAPTSLSTSLPEFQREWAGELGSTIDLTPATALFGSVEVGADNRLIRSKLGIQKRIWGK